mgnify:CR=1 FL=1
MDVPHCTKRTDVVAKYEGVDTVQFRVHEVARPRSEAHMGNIVPPRPPTMPNPKAFWYTK